MGNNIRVFTPCEGAGTSGWGTPIRQTRPSAKQHRERQTCCQKNRTKSRDAYREPKRKFPSGKTQTLSPVSFVLLLRAALQRILLCHLLEVVIYIGRWWVYKRIAERSTPLRILNYNLECVSPREHICKWPSVISDSRIRFNNYAMTICHIWFTIRFNNCSMTIASCLINNQIQ